MAILSFCLSNFKVNNAWQVILSKKYNSKMENETEVKKKEEKSMVYLKLTLCPLPELFLPQRVDHYKVYI